MRRRRRLLKILRVAGEAVRGCPFVVAILVAALAIERGVHPRERETSRLLVRVFGPEPGILGVARVAGLRKPELRMVGVRGLLVFREVARRTIRKDAILPPNERLMTSLAFHGGMGSDQRKKIRVISHLLPRGEPALHNVALGAIGTKLAQMDIGVAIRAILTDVREDWFRMALCAGYSRVSAAERVLSFVVVEI